MRRALLLVMLLVAPVGAAQVRVALTPHVGLDFGASGRLGDPLLGAGVEVRPIAEVPGAVFDPLVVSFAEVVLVDAGSPLFRSRRLSRVGLYAGLQARGGPGWIVRPRVSLGVERAAWRVTGVSGATARSAAWDVGAAAGLHGSRAGLEVGRTVEGRARVRLSARFPVL